MKEFRVCTDMLYGVRAIDTNSCPFNIAEDVGKSVYEKFFDEQLGITVKVIAEQKKQKQPISLSEAEKFAIAFVAGVKTETRFEQDSNILNITTEKVGVAWDGDKFLIVTEPKGVK